MTRIICTSIIKKIIFLAVFLLFFFGSKNVLAVNLLKNSGFEEGILPWKEYGAELALDFTNVHGGTGAIRLANSAAGSKWIYQIVPVTGGVPYVFSGYGIKNDSNISSLSLRIIWYSTADGNNSLSDVDSTSSLTNDSSEYRFLSTGAVVAPDNAHSAGVKGMAAFSSGSQSFAYFDDLTFEETVLPSPTLIPTTTPVPEPSATPTPTNIPTPTLTPTSQPPTNTPTPKPTAIPTIKPTPTFSVVLEPTESLGFGGTEPPSNLSAEEILGMSDTSPGGEASSSGFAKFFKNIPWFPVLAVGIGVLFIGFSLFTFIKGNWKIPPPNL